MVIYQVENLLQFKKSYWLREVDLSTIDQIFEIEDEQVEFFVINLLLNPY